jgi:hypothetical protein
MATAAEIRASILAGPQTQAALDQALTTYTPAEMAAAFPEYGGEEQYKTAAKAAAEKAAASSNAAQPSYAEQVAQWRAGAIASGATPQQIAYLDYRIKEIDPMLHTVIGDQMAAANMNPYSASLLNMASDVNTRANDRTALTGQNTTPWDQPNWQATQQARIDAENARNAKLQADWAALGDPFVAGPGGPARTGSPTGLLTSGTPTVLPTSGTSTITPPPAATGTPTEAIRGLLTTAPNLPPVQQNPVSTFASTTVPWGLANQYSRQYPQQDLANIRDWWSKTYGNREQAMSDMTKYGVTTQDISMATGEPLQGLATYLKQGGAPHGFGNLIEGAGGLFKRAADMAQQPGIQFGTTQGLLSDPTSQLARNILGRDTQYQQTAPTMGSGKWGMPSIAPGAGLLAPDYWLAAKTAEAQKTEATKNPLPVEQYGSGY